MDEQYVAVGVSGNRLVDVASEEVIEEATLVGPDHNQIGSALPGQRQQPLCCVPDLGDVLGIDSMPRERHARPFELVLCEVLRFWPRVWRQRHR
jgi:hypothetical protein